MKIIFLVTWIITVSNTIPCPQPAPYTDEYGRVHQNHAYTLQLCYDTTIVHQEKEFSSIEDARVFVKLGKEKCGRKDGSEFFVPYGCDLSDFEITEVRDDWKNITIHPTGKAK